MYLLDTNIISALRRPDRLPEIVRSWAGSIDVGNSFISAITVLEIEQGILAKQRNDQLQGTILRKWFDEEVLPVFDGRILAFDATVARRCATLHIPDPRPERDAMIAATAMVHRQIVVTRNVADFERLDVPLLNPWAGA